MNDDEWWEEEARSEAQQEAAAEEHFEKQAREWVRDNAAEFAREFFEDNYEKAVRVFTSERLQSFYVGHVQSATRVHSGADGIRSGCSFLSVWCFSTAVRKSILGNPLVTM